MEKQNKDSKDSKGRNLKTGEYQMPDGRYRYRYVDNKGIRRAVYSWRLVITDKTPKGKRETPPLRELELSISNDSKDNINTFFATSMTLNDLFKKYMNINVELRPSTKSNYISMWDKNIKNTVLANTPINKIKRSDIAELYSDFRDSKKFAVSTIQLYQNILFPTFQVAVYDDILRTNPCMDAMKHLKAGVLQSNRKPLTKEEQSALQKFIKTDSFYKGYYPMIILFLATGVRMGEMLGLTWNDIDFENNRIVLSHQVSYRRIDGKVQWYAGKLKWARSKAQSTRIIPVSKEVIDILAEHKKNCYYTSISSDFCINTDERDIKDFGFPKYYENFVFINSEGKLPTPASINRTLLGITNRYNKLRNNNDIPMPEFSAHVLRHTFATRNAENNMDIKVLQILMGHKNIGVTMDIYNHVSEERKRLEVSNTLSPISIE